MFKAKDIQNILMISKSRYDYIVMKIGIIPEIKEVSGTGHAHLYSFKNVMQIGISNIAINIRMSPQEIKDTIKFLDSCKSLWVPRQSHYPGCLIINNGGILTVTKLIKMGNWYKHLNVDGFKIINLGNIKRKIMQWTQDGG